MGRKPWLVVSANAHNRKLDSVIAVRLTTTMKNRDIPTVVELGHNDPLDGCILASTLMQVRREWFADNAGALAPATMRQVEEAIQLTLGLPTTADRV